MMLNNLRKFVMVKKIFKKFYTYWMKFAYILGEVNSKIIFTGLFFIVFGIYSLIARLLNLFKKNPPQTSYWVNKKYKEPTMENLKKQF